MPKATRKLLLDHVTNLASLTKAQRAAIVIALNAYDFPTAKGDRWRDGMVKAVSAADSVAARTLSIDVNAGTVTLKACS